MSTLKEKNIDFEGHIFYHRAHRDHRGAHSAQEKFLNVPLW